MMRWVFLFLPCAALGCAALSGLSDLGVGSTADGGTTPDAGSTADGGGTTDARPPSDAGATGDGGKPDTGLVDSPFPVKLGAASGFAILAATGIANSATSSISGDLGISPAAGSSITGFALVPDSSNTFATSLQVKGRVYAADYASPTPANLTNAGADAIAAASDAAGRSANFTAVGAGNIGGMTLTRGVYKWNGSLSIATNLTLSGSSTDVWIFQIAKELIVNDATSVVMSGGAAPKNVFWAVGSIVQIGAGAHLEGIVFTQTAVTVSPSASVTGRLFAGTAVALNNDTIAQPGP